MRYSVTIYQAPVLDARTAPLSAYAGDTMCVVEGVSLTKARRIVERAVRRGVRLAINLGNQPRLERANWGAKSGASCVTYVDAFIRAQS